MNYVSYVIDAQGLRTHPDKVLTIQQAPTPLNVTLLKLLMSSKLLDHFNPKFPLLFPFDASAYSISAILAHKMPNGSEQLIIPCTCARGKAIGFVCCHLSSARKSPDLKI